MAHKALTVAAIAASMVALSFQSASASTPDTTPSTPPTSTVETTTPTTQAPESTTSTSTTTSVAESTTTSPAPARSETVQQAQAKIIEGPFGKVRGPAARSGKQIQVTPLPQDPSYGLPANSGTGRRVVYHKTKQRVWAVDSNNRVVKTHLVSGRLTYNQPSPGTYRVFSRSSYTCYAYNASVCWRYMIRFTYGPGGLAIGFHQIPRNLATGRDLQSTSQLGTPLSAGCVRQAPSDAKWLWDWAPVGTKVVVIQ